MEQKKSYNYIAETLRLLRVQSDFSQQNVADILNINRSTYTYYETGKTTPDVRTLYKISKIFNVPIEVFFPDEEKASFFEDPVWANDKHRPKKTVSADPKKVGDLSSQERSLIALLRAEDRLSAEDLLNFLKNRLQEED